ncbi:hypothetical protein CC77DRAFT_287814 [Alternaria alternata]|uniref:F-box domain-containing protein n=1 Tax=Alternaria alternata TaxID=5599 RepID=A0A177DEV1_ALTAL|nr:hypothetical protein CC77DRAFT_287814 [Alternaria alternata]OAG17339.1 hypothetical protein CC77DRAFT_287814 [Alternaria alternata]
MREIDMEELMAFIREDLGSMLNDKHDSYVPNSLESLPCELIVMIAEYLFKKDLLTLRSLSNGNISRGIDDRFVEVCFSRRRCRTTIASVARLEALSCTRFAKRIRALEVYTIFDCQPSRFGDLATGKPCARAAISPSEVPWMFGRIFQRLSNLKNFVFRAPPGLWGMCDEELTNELPLFGVSETYPHLRFGPRYHFGLQGPRHNHVIDTRSIASLGYTLISSLQHAKQQLDSFKVLGFADSKWQMKLTSYPLLLYSMRRVCALRALTCLKLQLDMLALENESMTSLVMMIESNANLKSLHLSAGPSSCQRWLSRSENWAPLLRLLGSSPPFRLRSLELDGLVTSTSAPTLARIINVHSSSIRRVVLRHTNFHYPNTLREFFTACANSDIHYYRSESLLFHETSMLVGTSLSFRVFEDEEDELHREWSGEEDLDQCDLLDTACQDWVEVRFPSGRDMLVYDNENGQNGDDWMNRAFMAGVAMIQDGALIDS